MGIGLLVCATLGVLLTPWQWAFAAGLVVIAVLATTLCLAFRLGPPGPVFFVLMYGLSGNITSVTDGVRDTDPVIFLLALSTGVVFSYLIAIVPLIIPRVRREPAARLADLLPGPWLERGESTLIYAVALICVTPLVLLITSAATGEPNLMGTALERVVDTIAGALLAMATSFMHRK